MSGMGPILLFDKSTLQSLSVDESVWLDTFYFPCITPLFFVETLADLEKEIQKGRSPEDVVGNLAEKTPLGGGINVHHHTLSTNELLGRGFELRHVPVVAGGNAVPMRGGGQAVVFGPPPETEARARWQKREFLEVERKFAQNWRNALSNLDLESVFRRGREVTKRFGRPKDLAAAKALAEEIMGKRDSRHVREILSSIRPERLGRTVVERWHARGSPPIKTFAPFTAHVFLVDLVFCIALGADLIGRERPSNVIDVAYLYYLPFCMAFTSNDALHQRLAPLFLDNDQVFIPGQELKADLARLDSHYSQLPEEEKARGVMSFAHYPPTEGDFLVSRLWDKLMRPEWRERAARPREPMPKDKEADLISQINEVAGAAPLPQGQQDVHLEPGAVLIERNIPMVRGKWRMLPPEVLRKTASGGGTR